jgi:hypothetical protein
MDSVKPVGGAVLVATTGEAGFAGVRGVVSAGVCAARGMARRERAAARRRRFIARQHIAPIRRV